ncbi:hypothetical protein GQ53DRAFT_430881 [Thozetella sp. PMI_491]|nr:hypothetical protein GQ53DRAFT_430881 [Thozetella sp. PMI_491]
MSATVNRGGGHPIEKVVRGLAAGIGLASEAYHHNKEKKARALAEKQAGETSSSIPTPSQIQTDRGDETDEIVWELDDILSDEAGPAAAPSGESSSEPDLRALADSFIEQHPFQPRPENGFDTPAYNIGDPYNTASPTGVLLPHHTPRLELPVILTQRRPKARDRGFIRAYAPILEDVGIDQATFLEFLDKINTVVLPSPWINAINLASLAGMAVPQPFGMLISIAASMVVAAAKEVHSRSKTNEFLDKLNAEFFKPRGLICLVLTWRPESAQQPMTQVDFEGHMSAASNILPTSTLQSFKRKLRASDVAESFDWPEVAPLVFPDLEDAARSSQLPDAKKENVIKRAGKFIDDYQDRRATARWAGSNPNSKVANMAPAPVFHSRFADPNHPAASGNPLALLTGGHLNTDNLRGSKGRGREGLGRGREGLGRGRVQREQIGGGGQMSRPEGRPNPIGMVLNTTVGGAKKLLQKDVVYLIITNLPSEEELAQAASYLSTSELAS